MRCASSFLLLCLWMPWASAIPIIGLDATGETKLSEVPSETYVEGLARLLAAADAETRSALDAVPESSSPWTLGVVVVGVGLSLTAGLSPFFEVGLAPSFSLTWLREGGSILPSSYATMDSGYSRFLRHELSTMQLALLRDPVCIDEPRAAAREAWYFNAFSFALVGEVDLTVELASVGVFVFVAAAWMRDLPPGWVPYAPPAPPRV